MSAKLLILLIAAGSTLQQCTSIVGCLDCSTNSNVCITCNAEIMYYMVNGECVVYSRDSNCRRINSAGGCTLCSASFTLNANSQCVPVASIPNCLVYDNTAASGGATVCRVCRVGFTLTAPNTCAARIPNCAVTSPNGTQCLTCLSGFASYNNGASCVPINTDHLCWNVDPHTGGCLVCATNHNFVQDLCRPALANCSFADPSGLYCQDCHTGFYPSPAGACLPQAVPNCAAHVHNLNHCLLCANGYYLAEGACRPQSVASCAVFLANRNLCSECANKFYLTSDWQCVAQDVPSCASHAPQQNYCLVCNPGFFFLQGRCSSEKVPFCVQPDAQNKGCLFCIRGYHLDPDGFCIPNTIPNCALFVPNTNTCQVCNPGFNQVNGRCVPIPNVPNCLSYDGNGVCVFCRSGFFLSQGSCPPVNIDGCTVFAANQNLCLACNPRLVLRNNLCIFVSPVPNCLVYDTDTQCIFCANGYFLLDGRCHSQNVPNCLVFASNQNRCLACGPSHLLINNQCLVLSIQNCAAYDSNGRCLLCNSGFYLTNSFCARQFLPHCASFVPNFNVCVLCDPGFTLWENACQSSPNCVTLGPNGLCLICNEGFYVRAGGCVPQNVPNCRIHIPNVNLCQVCQPTYTLVEGSCTRGNVPHCDFYAPNGDCIQCFAGYYLSERRCVLQDILFCQRYLPNMSICAACIPTYLLLDNVCRPAETVPNCVIYDAIRQCQICNSGFYLSAGTCRPQDLPHCAQYFANQNICQLCRQNFVLVNTVCQEIVVIPKCADYDTNNNCVFCAPGYFLINGVCFLQGLPDCHTYIPNQNRCKICAVGFLVSNGVCVPVSSENCALRNSAGICLTCVSGFYLTSINTCAPQDLPFCLAYLPNLNRCQTCRPGFSLENGVCVGSGIPNCVQYNTENACIACASGFYLAGNSCLPQNVPNCAVYFANVNVCQVCRLGFHLRNNQCGHFPVPNCLFYGMAQNCIFCAPGYYLDRGLCVVQSLPNCAEYVVNHNICVRCIPPFTVQNNQCIRDSIPNCEMHNPYGLCSVCNPSFYVQNGLCRVQDVPNCAVYLRNQNMCAQCVAPYAVQNGLCVREGPLNCQVPNPDGSCSICDPGFYETNGRCNRQDIPNCASYLHNQNVCTACVPGFDLRNGVCHLGIPNCKTYRPGLELCDICQSWFYPDPTGQTCLPQNVLGCVLFRPNTNVCQQCGIRLVLNEAANTCDSPGLPHCETFNPDLSCRTCVAGHYVSEGQCVRQNIPRCQAYVPNTNTCVTCEFNFYLASSGLCLIQFIRNCARYVPNANRCAACAANFTLQADGSLCVYDGDPCEFRDANGVCQTCVQGFFLANNVCVPFDNVPNCLVFDLPSLGCLVCTEGYFARQGSCLLQNQPHCLQYLANMNFCVQCNVFYYPANGVCVRQTISNCVIFQDASNICLACAPGFYLFSASNSCRPMIYPFCQTPKPDNTGCEVCLNGFVLTVNGLCNPSVVGCVSYNDSNVCLVCAIGYYLTPLNLCARQDILGCAQYLPNVNLCEACLGVLVLAANKIDCGVPVIPNCLQYDENTWVCLECQTGFYLSNGVCPVQSLPNCVEYVFGQNLCQQCAPGYSLRLGVCFLTQIENCQLSNPDFTCQTCKPGFYLSGNSCQVQFIPNCSVYVPNFLLCSICHFGHYLGDDSICYSQNLPFCRVHVPNQNRCSACEPGYRVSIAGVCMEAFIDNCADYGANGECLQCQSGFYLSNNACLPQSVPNCISYFPFVNRCQICQKGYYVLNFQCEPGNVPFCEVFEFNTNNCLSCESGFILQNNQCVLEEIPNCEVRNGNVCLICMISFYVVNGQCEPRELPNCLTYEVNRNLCTFCEQGYYLNNGLCAQQNIPNCVQYQPNANVCTRCHPNFALNNNQCTSAEIPNCGTRNGNICVTCNPGSYVTPAGQCNLQGVPNCLVHVPNENRCSVCADSFLNVDGDCRSGVVIPNCNLYSNIITCAVCELGFYLSFNGCLEQGIENCITYTPNRNKCAFCMPGFLPNLSGQCLLSTLQFCEAIVDSATCSRCVDGFRLFDGECTSESEVPGCVQHVPNIPTLCFICEINLYVENGLCFPQSVADCNTYIPNVNLCAFCKSGFFLTAAGECHLQNIPNCAAFEPNLASCTACSPGFDLTDNICVDNADPLRPANCLIFAQGVCSACAFGFEVAPNFQSCTFHRSFSLAYTPSASAFYLSANLAAQPRVPYAATDLSNEANSYFTHIRAPDGVHVFIFTSNEAFVLAKSAGRLVLIPNGGALGPDALWKPEYVSTNQFAFKNGEDRHYIESATSVGLRPVPFHVAAQPITVIPQGCRGFAPNGRTCIACPIGQTLHTNLCVDLANSKRPANCIFFASGLCQACAFGFELSPDFLSCNPLASVTLTYFDNGVLLFLSATPPTLSLGTSVSPPNTIQFNSVAASGAEHVLLMNSDFGFAIRDLNGHLVLVAAANIDDSAFWSPEFASAGQFFLRNKMTGRYMQDRLLAGNAPVPFFAGP